MLPEELPEEDLQYQTRAEEEEPELRKATFPVPPPESFHRKAPAAGVRKVDFFLP